MLSKILIRNLIVVAIFGYLFLSNILHYEINFILIVVLIVAAWFISPVIQTSKYLFEVANELVKKLLRRKGARGN